MRLQWHEEIHSRCTAALCSRRPQRLALWVLQQVLLKSANRVMFSWLFYHSSKDSVVCLEVQARGANLDIVTTLSTTPTAFVGQYMNDSETLMDFCGLKIFVIRCEEGLLGRVCADGSFSSPRSDEGTWYQAQLLVDDYADIFPCLRSNLDKQHIACNFGALFYP